MLLYKQGDLYMKIKILVDSTFYLEEAFIAKHGIEVIPLNVIIDDVTYQDGVDISFTQVLDEAEKGKRVTTSQPSPTLFQEYFERMRDEGATDIICLTLSSTLSGTYQAASIAKQEVTGVNIHVVDTLSTSIGSEILTSILVENLNEGQRIEEVMAKIDKIKNQSGILMNMENLNALKRSGRINKIKATIGNLLRVKPIIEYFQGKVNINAKYRTEKQVAEGIVEKMKNILSGIKSRIHIYIAYVNSKERIKAVYEKIKQTFPNTIIKIRDGITPVVAINLGYGGFGVAWCYE